MKISILIFATMLLNFISLKGQNLLVKSMAFAERHYIPTRYTCLADNINPALSIKRIPTNTKTLAIVMMDSTSAFGVFDHWIVWNIPPTNKITENNKLGIIGRNSKNQNNYTGPCPPNGVHEYYFTIYALDTFLNLPNTADKKALLEAINAHVISKGTCVGLFQNP